MRLGAHFSSAGGYQKLFEKARAIGANALQLFSTSPRAWRSTDVSDSVAEGFKNLQKEFDVAPVYFHASYLVNLADGGLVGEKSKESLIHELRHAGRMGVKGSIIHLGSFKGKEPEYDTLFANIHHILTETPKNTLFIIENSGNRKIGLTLDEIGKIVNHIRHERVRVCLDTCHLFSAGYDITDTKKLAIFLKNFDEKVGLDRLEVWHLNDSRDPFSSYRDRHENIGAGTLGKDTFRALLNHPQMRGLPMIIETPGFDGQGPDKENLDILKSFIR